MRKLFKPYALSLLLLLFNQLLIMILLVNFHVKEFFHLFVESNIFILYNCVFVLFFYLIVYWLTNKKAFSWLIIYTITLIFAISNFLKYKYYAAPIMPDDFLQVKNIFNIMSYLNFGEKLLIVVLCLLIGYGLFAALKYDNKRSEFKEKPLRRVFGIFFCAIIIGVLVQGREEDNNFYVLAEKVGFENDATNVNTYYQKNGLLIGFVNLNGMAIVNPIAYTKDDIAEILKTPADNAARDDRNDIVIYILGESFYDPSRFSKVAISEDPIPTIHQLKEDYTSGLMQLTVNQKGTSLAEYETLTSFSKLMYGGTIGSPYYSHLPTMTKHPMIGNLFDNAIAIHTYTAKLYNREAVYKIYNFDYFKFSGSETHDLKFKSKINKSKYISDESGFKEILNEIKTIPDDESGFVYFAMMQNHSPYEQSYYKKLKYEVEASEANSELTDTDFDTLKVYLQGLSYTDKAIADFIGRINKIDRPITVVFFGDHYPYFSFDLVEDDEKRKTDYFIYQNYKKEKIENPLISANYLSTLMFQLTGYPKSPFYNLLENEFKVNPLVTGESFNRIFSTEKESDKGMRNYKIIQYDVLSEQNLLDPSFFENRTLSH